MGAVWGGGVNLTSEKKHMTIRGLEPRTYHRLRQYSDGIRSHGKLVNSPICMRQGSGTPPKVCGLPRLSGEMWIQTPISGFNFVTQIVLFLHYLLLKVQTSNRTPGLYRTHSRMFNVYKYIARLLSRYSLKKNIVLLSVDLFSLILLNSVDPDEIPHYTAFYLGLHCLLKSRLGGFPYTNGYFALF